MIVFFASHLTRSDSDSFENDDEKRRAEGRIKMIYWTSFHIMITDKLDMKTSLVFHSHKWGVFCDDEDEWRREDKKRSQLEAFKLPTNPVTDR